MHDHDTYDEIFDLEAAVKALCAEFPEIETVYLFGSRRYRTKSTRSDIDVLLQCSTLPKRSRLQDFILRTHSALDLFLVDGGRAESVANESFITSSSIEQLLVDLNAVEIYSRGRGSSEFLTETKRIAIDRRIEFKLTSLPNASAEHFEIKALQKYFRTAREHGLPTRPYLGISSTEAAEFIATVISAMPSAAASVAPRGQAASGWTSSIKSEYDFQNLFWLTAKPWLPGLAREEVAIAYDGKEKKADFNLFGSQLIIEFKHVKDDGDSREVVKTMLGLADFYTRHPNIRYLLFAVLVDRNVKLDDKKWEADFSYLLNQPPVRTIIVRNTR